MEASPRVIGYARVSTDNQAYQQALRQQTERLLDAGAQRVYADVASRTNDERTAIQEIMRLAEAGLIQTVLITRLDRVTSSPGLFEELTRIFQRRGVELLALDEQLNIHSIEGEFVAGLQVQFAKREVGTTRLRIKKSYEHRRKKSKPNTSVPWGYVVENGKYILERTPFLCLLTDRPADGSNFKGRTKAELGRDIVDLFFIGGTCSKTIALLHEKYGIYKFNHPVEEPKLLIFDPEDDFHYKKPRTIRRGVFCWSRDGISLYLRNPVLRGHTPYFVMHQPTYNENGNLTGRKRRNRQDWKIIYNTHPDQRLINDEEANRIDDMFAKNAQLKGFGSTTRRHLLTGLMTCALCGRGMKSQGIHYKGKERKRVLYYQCKNYREAACTAKTMIDETAALQAIVDVLVTSAQKLVNIAEQPQEQVEPPELHQLREQLAGLERLGHNPALEIAKQELKKQIKQFQYQLAEQCQLTDSNQALLLSNFADKTYWLTLLPDELKQVLDTLVERVIIRDGQVEQVILKL